MRFVVMLGWIVSIILLIPLVYFSLKYKEKTELDREEERQLLVSVELLKQQQSNIQENIANLSNLADEAVKRYNNSVRDYSNELEDYFNKQKIRRQQIMDEDIESRRSRLEEAYNSQKEALDLKLKNCSDTVGYNIQLLKDNEREAYESTQTLIKQWNKWADEAKQRYESLLEPIKQYEKEKQEKLFYTIQLPDEYKEDIDYLLTNVAEKVQHRDIISKLVWAEYVKPYLDETYKRIEIKDEPGIYKLTNIDSKKAYIGKSTNVKKRIADHFKSSVGIQSIADQAVHHEILKTGFWNWTIEVLTYCSKEKLNEMEKYYIDFFKTQEFGFNKNSGGGG